MLTAEQKAIRRTGIGGSDLAAILGLSTYKTPLDIYRSKIGDDDDDEENAYTYWGHALEPVIAEKYAQDTGYTVSEPTETFRHPIYSFMLANVDRIVDGTERILECKTANSSKRVQWGRIGTDQIPDAYLLQVAHYAFVLSKPIVDIAVLIGGNDFRIYTYQRNEVLEKKILQIEKTFWEEHVVPRIPPSPITMKDAAYLWPNGQDDRKYMENEQEEAYEELKQVKASLKELKNRETVLKLRLCSFLNDSSILVDLQGNYKASWKNQNDTRLNLDKFKKENPELYEKYSETKSIRKFWINEDPAG